MRAPSIRTASLTAASALTIASVSLLAAPAANAAPPAGSDIVGTAQINGANAADIDVELYAATTGSSDYDNIDSIDTDAAGTYGFDLDSYNPAYTSFKLGFFDGRTITGDQLTAHYEYYTDAPTLKRASAISRPTAGTVFTVPTQSLTLQSGIKGTISVPVPAGYVYSGNVVAYDEDDRFADSAGFDSDPLTTGLDEQTTYLLRSLDPGKTYTLNVFAQAVNPTTGDSINYISHFIGGGQKFDSASEFTTGASGSILQPVNDSVTNVLVPSKAPSIVGQVAPGKTLSVDNGTWNTNADNTYTYQWLVNGAQVSTASTYKVAKNDLGKKIQVIVTAKNLDNVGTAATSVTKVGYVTKLKAKAKKAVVKGKNVVQINGTLKVKGAKKNQATKLARGKVTVVELNAEGDEVKVGKGKVKAGKLQINLKGIISGKHEFIVRFEGGKKVAAVEKTVKVKV